MDAMQRSIIASLGVIAPFTGAADVRVEIERRIAFLQNALRDSGCRVLVLGISGGVDSLLAGRLAQLAVESLRRQDGEGGAGDGAWRFIAVRLPYRTQFDDADAEDALQFIGADTVRRMPIADAVSALASLMPESLDTLPADVRDRVLGNLKARVRMVAQFTLANAHQGLVIGTDHAAEAVMGFFTKYGDGACDLAPLSGLVKAQVRAMAAALGAPAHLVDKTPTADLEDGRPGLADEDAHGVRYADIDAFLQGQPVAAAAARRIIAAFAASRHKRALPLTP